jgi:DNA repair protein RadD
MLRIYQQAAVDAIISWLKYKDCPAIGVLPTGSGKTHVFAALIEHYYNMGFRICLLAHRKELLTQASSKITVPHSFYSASVGEKNANSRVVVAGIHSICNKDVGEFDIILIDECHRLSNSNEGMYWNFIRRSPNAKVAALTATPHRLEGGALGWGEIVYSIDYKHLQEAGYLAPLTNKLSCEPSLKDIKITLSEYHEGQLADVMSEPDLLELSIKKIMAYSVGRNSIMIFCVTVKHAELLNDAMRLNGMDATIVTGNTADNIRDDIIASFKSGQIRFLINCMVLLEGFDAPDVDMIVCLRPTKSRSLWWQMMGRGVRLSPKKKDCLLIDMAGNLREHGGMGMPFVEKAYKEAATDRGKTCPVCEEFVAVKQRQCACGYEFPEQEERKANHLKNHDSKTSVVYEPQPDIQYDVKDVGYYKHVKKATGSISLRVDYYCDGANYGKISEWVAPFKAQQFFYERGITLTKTMSAETIDELVLIAEGLKKPESIVVSQDGQWQRVSKYIWLKPSGLIEEVKDDRPMSEIIDDWIDF